MASVGPTLVLRREQVIAHSQYQKSQRISIFLSMQDEIETDEIIKDIFRRGKTCFIPRYRFQSNHMDMVRLASPEEIASLPKTSWNIPQPGEDEAREDALSTGEHAVPGLTCSVLGDCDEFLDLCAAGDVWVFGGRFPCRDKFVFYLYSTTPTLPDLGCPLRCEQLQQARPYTVALAFKEQICDQVPVDEHDMKVDEVLYEDTP
ncbi:PREDICTED: 5-formyltetrahydrofolate cyclo-ligase [Myotis davidii]|uniref:5-formyltetrahydrofolate cyclo-ligase n=1 Tax=Myotis davidii TaxID=225400 RepID=UPI0003EC5149|nr:PREDICTED: 5-formyltetrahydrofolate cyclo-ligase [Myotis davidii]